jgi:menaquinone-dependent protoporphyrinogen oxidase
VKALVVYSSRYGSTRRYAEWIAEDLGAHAVTFARAGREEPAAADPLVIESSVRSGKLTIASWLNLP